MAFPIIIIYTYSPIEHAKLSIMAIYFVSLISRENQPLYIQPFSPYENNWDIPEPQSSTSQAEDKGESVENGGGSAEVDTNDNLDAQTEKKDDLSASNGSPTEEKNDTSLAKQKATEKPVKAKSFIDERTKENELLKYNFLSHMALDVFDSPFMPVTEPEPRLGHTYNLLFVHDGVFVFGHETSTGMKIVVGCSREEQTTDSSERNLNGVFRNINRAYLRLVCNPFISSEKIDSEIDNVQFDDKISSIVESWNEQSQQR